VDATFPARGASGNPEGMDVALFVPGQPMANSGSLDQALPLAEKFLRVFGEHRYVVCRLRELRLGTGTERILPPRDKVRAAA
jgi:hypothetical protein